MAKWEEKRYYATLLLSCNCERKFIKPWPKFMDEVWCVKHNDKATIVRTPDTPGNFGWKCECGYGRTYGANKEWSEKKAAAHHTKHNNRSVRLYNGYEVYLTYEPP